MLTQQTAAWYLANATRTCPIPLVPEQFRRKDRAPHDYVFFGHVPVRSYKSAGQWKFIDADVLRAGRTMTELIWDPDDLVDLEHAEQEARKTDGFTPAGWRTEIRHVIDRAGAGSGCRCSPPQETATQHPRHTASDCLLRRYQDYTIACTLPVRVLVWVGGTWMIPRALALILDQRDERESELCATGRRCDGCGDVSPDDSWRTPTATGWKIICPSCAAVSLRRYRQELRGIAYTRVREHGPSAADFLCVICTTARPATDWDHCHAHDLIRGPLCGSCNTMEGQGKEFLARPGSLHHLFQCDGCRAQHSLPPHHRLAALRRYLHRTWGVEGCDWPMHMHVSLEEADGGYDCTVRCNGPMAVAAPKHGIRTLRSLRLTHEEAEEVLSRTAAEGLAQEA
ncbi:endonuclease domain-containing protein [Streptomyces chartreusis]|uniref:endonuclease domain-containing protein n=1 Tax=Streptomyces chartreusis TaxID=1969 RepID=UPI0036634F55